MAPRAGQKSSARYRTAGHARRRPRAGRAATTRTTRQMHRVAAPAGSGSAARSTHAPIGGGASSGSPCATVSERHITCHARHRSGGRSGIRTHGTLARTHAFQACALSRSAILPAQGGQTSDGAAAKQAGRPSPAERACRQTTLRRAHATQPVAGAGAVPPP